MRKFFAISLALVSAALTIAALAAPAPRSTLHGSKPSWATPQNYAHAANASDQLGFRVYLGTIPNYADSNDGLKLDGVRDDSPAAKAGLRAGDRIVKLAGRDIHNVYDYTYALGEMKAGQEYEVEVSRDGQRLTLKITPAARK